MVRAARFAGTLLGTHLLPLWTLAAQAPVLGLTLGGGEATDLRGNRGAAVFLAPALTLVPSPNTLLSFSGRGTRYGRTAWSAGGGAAALVRAPMAGRLGLLLQASGEATYASWRETYLQAELLPALELRFGAVTLSAGAKAAAARVSAAAGAPAAPLLPSGSPDQVAHRHALGAVWGASARIADDGRASFRLRYREEHLAIANGRLVDRTGGAELRHGRLTLTGSLGFRHAPGEATPVGGAQASLTIARGVALLAAFERYASNPLTQTVAGRSVSLGMSLRSGGLRVPRALPRPAGVPGPAPGFTRVAFRDERARTVEVAGDWNRWTPVRLTRGSNGVWYVDVKIDPGEYRYAFRVNGSAWRVPDGVAAVDDGFGGRSAWLSVREAGPAAGEPATLKEDG